MNLINIKPIIIKRVEDAIKRREKEIRINLDIINLFQHVKFLNGGPICYFKNKNSTKQILAHGAYQIFNNIQQASGKTSDLIIGAEKFPTSFPAQGEGYFFTPIITYTKNGPGHETEIKVRINYDYLKSHKEKSRFVIYISELMTFNNHNENSLPEISEIIEEPEIDDWKARINKAKNNLGRDKKIVLSRKKIVAYKKSITEASYLDQIPFNDEQYLFLLKPSDNEHFISVSPEKLYSLKNGTISIDCIAGTRKRGITKTEDQLLEKELVGSEKERAEHLFVANFIEEKMNQFASKITMTKAFDILKLSKVQHLYSEFKGQTNSAFSHWDILNSLFPTPAVAGTPSEFAIKNISKIEKSARNFYAGACGYIDGQESEFLVGIRSIYTKNNKTFVYGGAGIVSGSDFQKEWIETEEKMKNFSFLWEKNVK